MRANSILFTILGSFFILMAIVYTIWSVFFDTSRIAQETAAGGQGSPYHIEWVGTVALTLTGTPRWPHRLLPAAVVQVAGR